MTLTEKNILIAKFLGWKIDNSFPDQNRVWRSPRNSVELDTTLRFHNSWDSLIPVAKKCLEIIERQERPSINHCNDLDWLECQISMYLREYQFDEFYQAIIDFIVAYNKK